MNDELKAAIAGLRGPTTHTSHVETVLDALTDALDERDRLAAENVALREALRLSRAVGSNHTAHWDLTGRAGLGCPECIRRNEFNEETVNPLLTDPSPAVAEIDRLVKMGRQAEERELFRHDD